MDSKLNDIKCTMNNNFLSCLSVSIPEQAYHKLLIVSNKLISLYFTMIDKFLRTVFPYSWISPKQSRNWVEYFRAMLQENNWECQIYEDLLNNPNMQSQKTSKLVLLDFQGQVSFFETFSNKFSLLVIL